MGSYGAPVCCKPLKINWSLYKKNMARLCQYICSPWGIQYAVRPFAILFNKWITWNGNCGHDREDIYCLVTCNQMDLCLIFPNLHISKCLSSFHKQAFRFIVYGKFIRYHQMWAALLPKINAHHLWGWRSSCMSRFLFFCDGEIQPIDDFAKTCMWSTFFMCWLALCHATRDTRQLARGRLWKVLVHLK